jgi:iron complex outermembrane receptor protein
MCYRSLCLLVLVSTACALPLAGHAQTLEEIIVTAQKREQSLQDVSLAVSALSGTELSDSQIENLEDLQVRIPGLTVGNDFSFAKIFIRGIGMSSAFAGIDPSVALHVDGAVIAQAAGQFTALFDLDRIEVLRGPQGTLYGRNATGGSINLVTAKPTREPSGFAEVTLGGEDFNLITEGAISGPLTDSILGRASIYYQDRDGYGVHTGTGEDVDDANVLAGRGHLQFNFGDDADLLLTGQYYQEDDHSKAAHFFRASFPVPPTPGLMAIGLPNVYPDSRNVGGDFRPTNDRETWAGTGTLTWRLNDTLTLRSITNYREFEDLLIQDFDVSDTVNGTFPPSPTSTTQRQYIDEDQFSEELQLLFQTDRLRGIAALYYITESIDSDIRIGRDPDGFPDLSRVIIVANLEVDAWAAFFNLTYDLTSKLALKVGARYSDEERKVTNLFGVAAPPDPAANFDPVKTDSATFSDTSPEIGLEYRPNPELLFYVTYSEGFKSGTANLGERSPRVVDPETVENIEAGVKSRLFDGRLIANLALFDYEVTDAQFDRTFPIPVPPFFAATLENAATTDGKGAELEVRWRVTDRLAIDFAGTLYDIEFSDFLSRDPLNPLLFGPGGLSVPPEQLAGNSPRNTPEWTVNFHPTYELPIGNGATLTFGANIYGTDDIFFTEFNNPAMGQEGYWLYDANVLYRGPDERLSVNVWGKNLSDDLIRSGSFAISTSRTITGTYLPPRTYGVTVGYRF